MDSLTQIISFIVSFVYGIGFYMLAKFNKSILYAKKDIWKFIVTFIFIIDIVILYLAILFKINKGTIHPYFIITLIFGFVLGNCILNLLKNICKKCVNKIKKLK